MLSDGGVSSEDVCKISSRRYRGCGCGGGVGGSGSGTVVVVVWEAVVVVVLVGSVWWCKRWYSECSMVMCHSDVMHYSSTNLYIYGLIYNH